MKKLNIVVLVLLAAALLIGAAPWTSRQTKAHDIAEIAREMGLSEDNPIIVEASRLWWAEREDTRIIANVVYNEAGNCTTRHKELVAAVVLNRVASPRFPNTVREVVEAPRQYDPKYAQNLPDYATADETMRSCFHAAIAALSGEVECPKNVVYQSEFPNLGTGNYETIVPTIGQTTYFNYE